MQKLLTFCFLALAINATSQEVVKTERKIEYVYPDKVETISNPQPATGTPVETNGDILIPQNKSGETNYNNNPTPAQSNNASQPAVQTNQPIVTSPGGMSSTAHLPIEFHQGTLESALKRAKEESKLIFLDFYADWCGPCKLIEKEVFIEPQFYNYINENFIAVKIFGDDLEQGGYDYAEQMKVKEWPTLMVLNAKGSEMGRVSGYNTTHTYLLELKRIERYSAYKR